MQIVNTDILNRTEELLSSIRKKANLYVQNNSFPEALKILSDHKCCIISGIPGIGKTTLSEIILLNFARQGFEVIMINEIQQGYRTFQSEKKQIYFFDDFLGQTFLNDNRRSDDASDILRFMEKVAGSTNHYFVMTTREHILQKAHLVHERIGTSNLTLQKCTVDLQSYTKKIKAQILLNHLYFSQLPEDYLGEIVRDGRYLAIINHANFNPRVIERLTDVRNIITITKEKYYESFIQFLKNPHFLWQHSFESVSVEAQCLILVVGTFQKGTDLEIVKEAFEKFYFAHTQKMNMPRTTRPFYKALKETEGSFTITHTQYNQRQYISYYNPSISDFINSFYSSDMQVVERLAANATSFSQLVNIMKILNRDGAIRGSDKVILPTSIEVLKDLFKKDWSILPPDVGTSYYETRYYPEVVAEQWLSLVSDRKAQELIEPQVYLLVERLSKGNCRPEAFVSLLKKLERNETLYFGHRESLIQYIKSDLPDCCSIREEIDSALSLIDLLEDEFTDEELGRYEEQLVLALREDVKNLISDEKDADTLEGYVQELDFLTYIGISQDVENLKAKILEKVKELKDEIDANREDYEYDREYVYKGSSTEISDEDIKLMFESIKK